MSLISPNHYNEQANGVGAEGDNIVRKNNIINYHFFAKDYKNELSFCKCCSCVIFSSKLNSKISRRVMKRFVTIPGAPAPVGPG